MGRTSNARQCLIDSAVELIYARSYADVGVQEICEHAGVQKGSFYHFFDSKQALTLSALEQQWALAKAQIWEPAFAPNVPPLKRIERFFRRIYEHQRDLQRATGGVYGCPFGNLGCELSTQNGVIRLKVVQGLQELSTYVERALREAMERGDVPPIDIRASAQAIIGYMEGIVMLAKTQNDPSVIRQLSAAATHILVIKSN